MRAEEKVTCGHATPPPGMQVIAGEVVVGHEGTKYPSFQHDFIDCVPNSALAFDHPDMLNVTANTLIASDRVCHIMSKSIPRLRCLAQVSGRSASSKFSPAPDTFWTRRLRSVVMKWWKPERQLGDTFPRGAFWPIEEQIRDWPRTPRSKPRVLLLSRAGVWRRTVKNEADVLQRLQKWNEVSTHVFSPTVLASSSPEEVQKLFYDADLVLGLHGGAFSNIAYCHPSVSVIEINLRVGRDCFLGIAYARGFSYRRLELPTMNYDSGDVTLTEQQIVDLLAMAKDMLKRKASPKVAVSQQTLATTTPAPSTTTATTSSMAAPESCPSIESSLQPPSSSTLRDEAKHEEFILSHYQRIINARSEGKGCAPPAKMLRYVCDQPGTGGGLGDRVRGVVSVFALSLATGSEFLLSWDDPEPIGAYYELPKTWATEKSAADRLALFKTRREVKGLGSLGSEVAAEVLGNVLSNKMDLGSYLTNRLSWKQYLDDFRVEETTRAYGLNNLTFVKLFRLLGNILFGHRKPALTQALEEQVWKRLKAGNRRVSVHFGKGTGKALLWVDPSRHTLAELPGFADAAVELCAGKACSIYYESDDSNTGSEFVRLIQARDSNKTIETVLPMAKPIHFGRMSVTKAGAENRMMGVFVAWEAFRGADALVASHSGLSYTAAWLGRIPAAFPCVRAPPPRLFIEPGSINDAKWGAIDETAELQYAC